jgi:hypothetical protein
VRGGTCAEVPVVRLGLLERHGAERQMRVTVDLR